MRDTANDSGLIDVRRLIEELSVEELCRTAEEFFARRADWNSLRAKPFAEIDETPELLVCFAQVVRGLRLLPDMTVLDFGAGSCWTSRFLSQLGLRVIALDVSPSALKMGKELYRRHPLIGNQPAPRFLQFNGRTFDLPDASVDRISCWESFHHVPNPAQVLKEMARVLKPGGIAGFSEPGPDHSKSPQSQDEMRLNRVVENDVNVREIWAAAREAGFTEIKLALFNPEPFLLPLEEFEVYLTGRDDGGRYASEVRRQMESRRLFFLFKGESSARADSRRREGLLAELRVEASSGSVAAGRTLRLRVVVKNVGSAAWLPTPQEPQPGRASALLARLRRRFREPPMRVASPAPPRVGGVRLGVQLFDDRGELSEIDYYRHHLTPGEGREIAPGETVEFTADVPMPRAGRYTLQCDLVSEMVGWFEHNGSQTARLNVEVT
jgi:SAM-dependent methyltransferase